MKKIVFYFDCFCSLSLLNADFSTAAALIAFGAILGKARYVKSFQINFNTGKVDKSFLLIFNV
jgi:hypothetical protein